MNRAQAAIKYETMVLVMKSGRRMLVNEVVESGERFVTVNVQRINQSAPVFFKTDYSKNYLVSVAHSEIAEITTIERLYT